MEMIETGQALNRAFLSPRPMAPNTTKPIVAPCRVTMTTVMADLEHELGELEKVVIEYDRILAPVMIPAAEERGRAEPEQTLPALIRLGTAQVSRLRNLREALASMASRVLIEQ